MHPIRVQHILWKIIYYLYSINFYINEKFIFIKKEVILFRTHVKNQSIYTLYGHHIFLFHISINFCNMSFSFLHLFLLVVAIVNISPVSTPKCRGINNGNNIMY